MKPHDCVEIAVYLGLLELRAADPHISRFMPAPEVLSREFEMWRGAVAPPPETSQPRGEPDEPEGQYPFWTSFIENPRPKA